MLRVLTARRTGKTPAERARRRARSPSRNRRLKGVLGALNVGGTTKYCACNALVP